METEREKPSRSGTSDDVSPTHVGGHEDVVGEQLQTPILESGIDEDTPLLAPVPFYRNKNFIVKLTIGIAIIAGGIYYAYTNNVFSPAVATVNGVKITQEEYNESVSLIEDSATLQGINLADINAEAVIKQQALDVLIDNLLLITAAKKEGLSVTKEEVDEKYAELVSQLGSGEELAARMAEVGLTEKKLKSNIADRVLADKYIETTTDIENVVASEEEITEFYTTIKATNPEVPPLEAIKDQVAGEIQRQKQQQIIDDVLKNLREKGEIVVNI
jgi:hypothetical protein